MNASSLVIRFCASGLVALSLNACAASSPTDDAVTSAPSAAEPSTTDAPLVDLVALIEGIPGYTYAPAPDVEQAFASEGEKGFEPVVVRAVLLQGNAQGNVIILPRKQAFSDQELRDFLVGAEGGGNKQGTATRSEIAGAPAVKVVRADGGTTYITAKGRYGVIVGARPGVADDLAKQLLARLPD